MSDSLIQKLEAKIHGKYTEKEAYGRGLDSGFRVAIGIIRQHEADNATIIVDDPLCKRCWQRKDDQSGEMKVICDDSPSDTDMLMKFNAWAATQGGNISHPHYEAWKAGYRNAPKREYSGLCSAHQYGQDKDCRICYPSNGGASE